jgi:hypothetical protein
MRANLREVHSAASRCKIAHIDEQEILLLTAIDRQDALICKKTCAGCSVASL